MTLNEKLLSTPKLFARENDIIKWGIDRSIVGDYANGTFEGQQEKTRQEWQEYQRDRDRDGLGDVFVTLVMQCALKGTTVSDCIYSCPQANEFNLLVKGMDIEFTDGLIDFFAEKLIGYDFMADNNYTAISSLVSSLYSSAYYRGWTLEECIEVAWNDIKDRKGLMLYGMFIKQTNLDALQELGITYDKDLQAFTGTIFLDSHLKRADEIFYNLGITYTCTGDYSSGVYVESTGSN